MENNLGMVSRNPSFNARSPSPTRLPFLHEVTPSPQGYPSPSEVTPLPQGYRSPPRLPLSPEVTPLPSRSPLLPEVTLSPEVTPLPPRLPLTPEVTPLPRGYSSPPRTPGLVRKPGGQKSGRISLAPGSRRNCPIKLGPSRTNPGTRRPGEVQMSAKLNFGGYFYVPLFHSGQKKQYRRKEREEESTAPAAKI